MPGDKPETASNDGATADIPETETVSQETAVSEPLAAEPGAETESAPQEEPEPAAEPVRQEEEKTEKIKPVMPVFDTPPVLSERAREILKRSRKKKKSNDDDDDDKDEDEWAEAVIEIEEIKVKQAQIGETYIKRLCKIISGEKVFKALKAEDTFHRQILKNFRKEDR